MKKITIGVGFRNLNKYVRRSALFFLITLLAFGLFEPGASRALAQRAENKTFNLDYKLDPLDATESEVVPALTEQTGGSLELPKIDNPRGRKHEETGKRTPFTSTFVNNDGTRTLKWTPYQQNFKKDGKWHKLENKLKAVEAPKPESNWWQDITNSAPKAEPPSEFKANAGNINGVFKNLSRGLDIKVEDKSFTIVPNGARDVKPESLDERSVIYRDAWKNTDLIYEMRGESIKEIIVLKNKDAQAKFNFAVKGGDVINHPSREGELTIKGMPEEYSFSALTLDLHDRGVISEERVTQAPTKDGKGIGITMDAQWLKEQPASSFPMRIDPSLNRAATSYWMFKSDGYSCGAHNCYANIGTLYDNGWKHWRTYFQFPFSDLAGKKILHANLHGFFQGGINGDQNGRGIAMGHANCVGYWCQGSQVGWTHAATDFDIDFTAGLQQSVNNHDWGTVWSLWGEEGAYKTYKPYWDIGAYVHYDTPTPVATPTAPADKQAVVDTMPTLKVNPVGDADGDSVKYYFRVSTNKDAETGAVINSGWIDTTQWTIPDGILQDGTTYYWHVYTLGATQTNPNWVRSFKVDLRTGKDSTQSYDTVGPVGVDLATGNSTLSANTHTMSALGGDMGLNLTYNTPNRAQKGLKVEYWNVASSYNFANGAPTSSPARSQRAQAIDFNWGTGTPTSGVNSDWFYARWTGQFVAPVSGVYRFGGSNDDNMKVTVNGQVLYNQGCYSGICYDSSKSITLAAGQAIPVTVDYLDAVSLAYAKLYVKGAVSEQIVPRDWLYTNVTNEPTSYGLTGRYYTNPGYADIDAAQKDPSRLMLVRQDTKMNLNFGSGGPAPGMQVDNFMARWKGYITVPTAGTYTLGADSDDGLRIKVNSGGWKTVLDRWQDQSGRHWGSAVNLPANTPIPIQVDWFERGGGANLNLLIQGNGHAIQEIPVTWLTPDAKALPEQWDLGVDVNGNVSYERLRVSNSSVILKDSTGSTHEYTYTNGGYKPPVNEDGTLNKNADNTYTLVDVDGRTYIFDTEGKLTSLTSPADDRQPANLKYIYAGDPSRLVKVEDGVTSARFATVYYKGINDTDNICDPNGSVNSPSSFFGILSQFDQAPNGMLCAFKTSDGDVTNFYYKNGNLARIVQPGSQITDYAYDSMGRMSKVRDSMAADVIGAGLRADDDSVTTQLEYDSLARISKVTAPSATAGATRTNHLLSYAPGTTDLRIEGASEPNGYSRRVKYDSLLRTTSDTDLTGKTIQTEWDSVKDLQLSTTDPTGLKSTTIYDSDDRVVDSYGPAPATWYGSDRRPLAAHANQVPRTSTTYDQGLKGPAVTWYKLKRANMSFVDAPKAYTTGFASNNAPESGNPAYLRHDFRAQSLPFTIDADQEGYGFIATGKIRVSQSGNYTFTAASDDSVRLLIDDQQILSNWGTRTTGDTRNSTSGSMALTAGKVYRFAYHYGHEGMSDLGSMGLDISGPGISGSTRDWSAWLQPGYNLETSMTTFDNQIGNTVSTTQYSNPAYGTVSSTTLDPAGLNYVAQATYESPGVGYMRQTSKTLPGGAKTTYHHYSSSDTRDNPCTAETEAYRQAGLPKGKTEPDPDGSGTQSGRSSETIYNESGDVVATRFNTDAWTCMKYDARGRVAQTVIPQRTENGQNLPGRTIIKNYAVNGSPLITSTGDDKGTIVLESDLLGRTIKYTDARGNITINTHDQFGKLLSRSSKVGLEAYEYDKYDRLTTHKLDGVTFASVSYDEFSRINSVQYPNNMMLKPAVRDMLGRVSKVTYGVGDQEIYDIITRSTSGLVLSGDENGVAKNYAYDKAGRLLSATIGNNTFTYGFGTADNSCGTLSGNNPNAAKDSNRTSYTVNGDTTTYCYDMADRLLASSDTRFTDVRYDSHGNTTSLGDAAHKTEFTYDAADRNISIKEVKGSGTSETAYQRDVSDRVLRRTHKVDTSTKDDSYYGFISGNDSPAFLTDTSGAVTQKYIVLPGGVRVTIKPQSTSAGATTYSLTNTHGDVMATVNADGAPTVVAPTGPFGERTPEHNAPANFANGTSNAYLGAHSRPNEVDYSIRPTQMGARVYIPDLGRFLQVDPVEGGALNNYVYAMDPVNQHDVSGKAIPFLLIGMVARATISAAARVILPAAVGLGPIRGPIRVSSIAQRPTLQPTIRAQVPSYNISPQVSNRLNQIRTGQGASPGYSNPHPYKNFPTRNTYDTLPPGKYTTYDVYPKKSFSSPMDNKERIVHDSLSGRSYYTSDHYKGDFLEIY